MARDLYVWTNRLWTHDVFVADAVTKAAVDISAWSFASVVKATPTGSTLATVTCAVIDGPAGHAQLVLQPSDTTGLWTSLAAVAHTPPTPLEQLAGCYDVKVTISGAPLPFMDGKVWVRQSVTP